MVLEDKLTLIDGLNISDADKNALKDLWLEYNQSNYKGSFEQFLLRGRQYDDGFNYNGVPKETLAATARTYSEVFTRSSTPNAKTNSITDGKRTQTEVKDKSSIIPKEKPDLPVNSVSDATNQMTVPQEQANSPTPKTPIEETPETPPVIGDNPELQEEKTETPSTDNQNTEENEANQEPGGPGTMEPSYVTRGKAVFRRLSDITSNMNNNNNNNNNNQEPPPVREEEEDMIENEDTSSSNTSTTNKPSTTTATTATPTPVQEEKTPTPAPTRTNTPARQPAEIVDRSEPEMPAIRPVDRGRFDYIRNNGWGSNSSILTRMGYSPEEIRRILDNSGAVRPEYFSY